MFKGLRSKTEKLVWLMGVTATMPVLAIAIRSFEISAFRVLFYGMIVYLFIQAIIQKKIYFKKYNRMMCIWLIIGIIGGIVGMIVFNSKAPSFASAARSYIPKTGAFLIFAVLWGGQKEDRQRKLNSALIRGLLFGCALNAGWAMLDAAGYYLFHKSINNIVFAGYIARNDIRFGELSLIINGMIRSGGFNYDPAQLGFIAPILMCYGLRTRKKIYIVLSLGSILASASTTALVCSLVILIFDFHYSTRVDIRKPRKNTVPIALGITVLLLFAVVLNWNRIASMFGNTVSKMMTRVNQTYIHSEKADIRVDYLLYAPQAFFHLGAAMITGTGFGTASYGYVSDPAIAKAIGVSYFPYDPENTYICYLMDTGLIGFCLILFVLIKLFLYYRRKTGRTEASGNDKIIYSGIFATVLSMLFYHYILFAPQMLFLIAGLCRMDLKDDVKSFIREGFGFRLLHK